VTLALALLGSRECRTQSESDPIRCVSDLLWLIPKKRRRRRQDRL